MRRSRGVMVWLAVLLVALVCAPLVPVRAESGTPPAPNTQSMPQPYVPPLNPLAPAVKSPVSGRAVPSDQAAPEAATLAAAAASALVSNPVVDMKVLVLYRPGDADGVYAMVKGYLDNLGIPYATLDTAQAAPAGTLEASDLGDGGSRGYYYAVFITTSNIWAALSSAEKTTLTDYERAFGVREVTWYAYPNPTDYGLNFTAVTAANNDATWCPGTPQGIPFTASLTAAGQAAFGYLRPDVALSIEGPCMYGYLGQPAAGADVTPLLVNSAGETFLAVYRPGDGRERLVLTEGSFYPAIPPAYLHAQVLPYGMINWATRGVFLGERHVYFVPQPDDVLGWGDRWDAVNHRYILDTGYRNSPGDFDNLVAWQNAFRANTANASGFRIEMPFNGEGSLEDREGGVVSGAVLPGTLTAKAQQVQGSFTWLNHTYTHREMGNTSLAVSTEEIALNTATAANLGFTDYSNQTLLTGDYSGINPPNPNLATAAYDLGLRSMEANASVAGYNNPTPNTGIPHPTQPAILLVPRYANNIFYAVTTPEEETDLYKSIYCTGYPTTDCPLYTYNYIIDSVTNQALRFMLDYSVNATMFHMNNFNNYGGGRTVMTDFIEALYARYNAVYAPNAPVLSLRTQEIGQKMRDRMAYNASGISGQLACGNQITLHTNQKATIPLTGVSYGSNVETYAGQPISYIPMGANATVVIPGAAAKAPAAIAGLTAALSGSDVVLNWPAVTQATDGSALSALVYRVYARANDPMFTPTPADLVAEVAGTTFTHSGGADPTQKYTYVVTAIGNNCWKLESALSNRVAANHPPVAIAQSVMTAEDTAAAVTLTGSDVDGSALTYRVVSSPSHGTLSGTAPNLTYGPATNYNGPDSFTFVANDGTVDSAPAVVSITVTPVNDPPVATAQSVMTAEDTAAAVTLTGSDVDGNVLTYRVVSSPSHGTLSGTAPNLTYRPAANYSGPDSFTFVANDGTVDSAPAVVSITVTPVNDPPVAATQSVTTAEDTAAAVTLTGSDVDGNVLTYRVVSSPSHGTLSGTAPNLTYGPATNYSGPDSFTFVANDGTVDSAPAVVSITVTPVNDPPVATAQSVMTAEDTAAAVTLTGSDVDGSALTYRVVGSPSHGTLSGTAPNLTYRPAANYSGPDSFAFVANDGTVDSAPAVVSITVTPVNDPPVAAARSVTAQPETTVSVALTGSDVDGNALTYRVVSSPSHGTLSGTAPNLTYTPAGSYSGPDSFTFVANDGQADSAPAMISITVARPTAITLSDFSAVATLPPSVPVGSAGFAVFAGAAFLGARRRRSGSRTRLVAQKQARRSR